MRLFWAAACGLLAGAALAAQEPFRSEVDTVRVTATVLDAHGRFAAGLTKADFRIVDGGREQPIVVFSADPQPVSVVFLIDVSGSMEGAAYRHARNAVGLFARRLLGPSDEVFACVFNDAVACLSGPSRDPASLAAAMTAVVPNGPTRLYDGINLVVDHVGKAAHPKQALIVMSDGNDTGSARSASEARQKLLQAGMLTYAIGFRPSGALPRDTVFLRDGHPGAFGGVNMRALRLLTEATGGRVIHAALADRLDEAVAEIADELGRQYHLGYFNPRPPDGKYHEITVSVRRKGYEVRARHGYVAKVPGT